MGIILSKFSRKKKSTFETLEELEKKIHKIEEYRNHTEQRHKKIVGNLILYSISLYVISALLFYFYFFPASLKDQLFCILPLLFFPILVVFIKKIVSWYYDRKVLQNEEKISTMREEKKEILDMVMEKETYKVAKEILEKFAPEQLRSQTKTSNLPSPNIKISGTPGTELKRRAVGGQGQGQPGMNTLSLVPQKSPVRDPRLGIVVPPGKFGPAISGLPRATLPVPNTSQPPTGQIMRLNRFAPPQLTRPIIPRERGVMDRLVDYIMADGPSNRYALICKECHSHNGMALKEEFEYLAFHCCFCNAWNPARKQRPHAPRLQPYLSDSNLGPQTSSIASKQEDATSSSELESASDSEDSDSKSESSKKSPTQENDVTQQQNQENVETKPTQEPEKMDVDLQQNTTSENSPASSQ